MTRLEVMWRHHVVTHSQHSTPYVMEPPLGKLPLFEASSSPDPRRRFAAGVALQDIMAAMPVGSLAPPPAKIAIAMPAATAPSPLKRAECCMCRRVIKKGNIEALLRDCAHSHWFPAGERQTAAPGHTPHVPAVGFCPFHEMCTFPLATYVEGLFGIDGAVMLKKTFTRMTTQDAVAAFDAHIDSCPWALGERGSFYSEWLKKVAWSKNRIAAGKCTCSGGRECSFAPRAAKTFYPPSMDKHAYVGPDGVVRRM